MVQTNLLFRQVKAIGRHSTSGLSTVPQQSREIHDFTPQQSLNPDMFCGHRTLPAMEKHVRKTQDIVRVIADFALIHKKPVGLFGKLKARILSQLHLFTANDLGVVCNGWARLGFLKEDFLLAISERIADTAAEASTDALVHLLDGYASARMNVDLATNSINAEIAARVQDMAAWQVALHLSSLARLNLRESTGLLVGLAHRSHELLLEHTARDLALVVYSLGKLGFQDQQVLAGFSSKSLELARDFTAKELEMVATGFARLGFLDESLSREISLQASRRIAQFSGSTLSGLVRAWTRAKTPAEKLEEFLTRAMAEMPRITAHMELHEAQDLKKAFDKLGVRSAVFEECVQLKLAPCVATAKAPRTTDTPLSVCEGVDEELIQLTSEQSSADLDIIAAKCGRLMIENLDAGRAAEVYCALAKVEGWKNPAVGLSMQTLMQRAISTDF